jgi:hypothetical protein
VAGVGTSPVRAHLLSQPCARPSQGSRPSIPVGSLPMDWGSVPEWIAAVGTGSNFSTPETARGRRVVALDPATVTALRGHRKAQAQHRLLLGRHYHRNLVLRSGGRSADPPSGSERPL